MNKGKKALAVLSTAALLGTTPAAVALPFLTATVAHAAGTATALVVPNINNATPSGQTTHYENLGTIDIFWPKGSLASGTDNQVTFMLPSGFTFATTSGSTFYSYTTSGGTTYYDQNGNTIPDPGLTMPNAYGISGTPDVDQILLKWEFPSPTLVKLTVLNDTTGEPLPSGLQSKQTDDWNIYLRLGHIQVNGPSEGPVNVQMIAPSNSALPTGSVTVANVVSSGKVDLAAADVQSGSNDFAFNLAVNEEVAGSLKQGDAIKLKLPSGFKWYDPNAASGPLDKPASKVRVYGQQPTDIGLDLWTDHDQNLWIKTSNTTTQASGYLIVGLQFYVDDETVAKQGDVTVQVTGSSTTNVSDLVVGHYGQIGFTSSVASKPTLIAGHKEQIIGDIIIKETVPGSFISGRTVTLQLPDGARWESPFEDSRNATSGQYTGSISVTNGLSTPIVTYTDTDRRTLKLTVQGSSNASSINPAEIDLRNMQVAIQPGFTGDLTIQLGGTEGVTGSLAVATVQSPVSVNVDTTPNVIVGTGAQAIGTITLTENVAGGFAKNSDVGSGLNKVHLELPYGVQFDGTPDVQVTQGDLRIKDVSTGLGSDNKGYLDFYVDAESTTPSQITISNAKLKLDRTVPEGDVLLKVKGQAVSYTAYAKDAASSTGAPAVQAWYDNNTTAAKAVIAKVTTPAQAGSNVATFTVGSTTYTVNGQQQTMDVAPYLKNDGRVMLPVRFVANALGVTDDHIVWNGADQSVTIFKGNTVAKMTVGSNTMVVNGVAVQMDVAPELYNDGRVMLPIRWIGQALGAQLTWDQNTQTVTVTSQQ